MVCSTGCRGRVWQSREKAPHQSSHHPAGWSFLLLLHQPSGVVKKWICSSTCGGYYRLSVILEGCSYLKWICWQLGFLADFELIIIKVKMNHCLSHFSLPFSPHSFIEPITGFALPSAQSQFAVNETGSAFEGVTHITSKCCLSSQIYFE